MSKRTAANKDTKRKLNKYMENLRVNITTSEERRKEINV